MPLATLQDVLERVRRFANRAQDDLGINAVVRFSRAFTYGAWVALDYKLSLMGMDAKSEEYAAAKSKVDLRSAKRLLHVCQTHQGVWTKFGQYVASLVKVGTGEAGLRSIEPSACDRSCSGCLSIFLIAEFLPYLAKPTLLLD
jgi:hypothetical protein